MTGDNRVSVIASLLCCSYSEYSVHAFSHNMIHTHVCTFKRSRNTYKNSRSTRGEH